MSGVLMETIHTRQINGRFKLIALITHISPFTFYFIRAHRLVHSQNKWRKKKFVCRRRGCLCCRIDESFSCSSSSHVSFFLLCFGANTWRFLFLKTLSPSMTLSPIVVIGNDAYMRSGTNTLHAFGTKIGKFTQKKKKRTKNRRTHLAPNEKRTKTMPAK